MLETEERKKMYEQAGISAPVFEYGREDLYIAQRAL